jgi:hypothetical protein
MDFHALQNSNLKFTVTSKVNIVRKSRKILNVVNTSYFRKVAAGFNSYTHFLKTIFLYPLEGITREHLATSLNINVYNDSVSLPAVIRIGLHPYYHCREL